MTGLSCSPVGELSQEELWTTSPPVFCVVASRIWSSSLFIYIFSLFDGFGARHSRFGSSLQSSRGSHLFRIPAEGDCAPRGQSEYNIQRKHHAMLPRIVL